MRPTDADAFRLAVEGGRVLIDFGRGAPPSAADPRGTVALSDRVELAPEVAARLLDGLREALQQRAPAAPGQADAAASRADPLAAPAGAGATPANLPPDPAAQAAARLLDRIRELGVPYQHERSFRMAPASLQANRFLVSMNRADLGEAAIERALAIGAELGMPQAAQEAARSQSGDAHCVHFGFEAGEGGVMCKLYLERKVPEEEAARAAASGGPALLHLAFKWDVHRGAHVVTRYDWYPGLSVQGIEGRLRALYGEAGDAGADEAAQIACEVLALAGARVGDLQYLEVHEGENARRSFDLNLYDAGLQVRDLLPMLLRMRDLYGIRPGHFQTLVDQIRSRSLGHLAGGVHRNRRGFFNVYYGVEGFPRFASRLR